MEINPFIRKLIPFFYREVFYPARKWWCRTEPPAPTVAGSAQRVSGLCSHRRNDAAGVCLAVPRRSSLCRKWQRCRQEHPPQGVGCNRHPPVGRTDLVKQFFTRSSPEAPDIDKVIFLVYTERRDDGKQNPGTSGTASANRVQEQRLSCAIRAEDMPLLADCANDSSFFHRKWTVWCTEHSLLHWWH